MSATVRALDLSPHHQIRVVLNAAGTVDIRLWCRAPETRMLRSTSAGFILSSRATKRLGALLLDINSAY